MVQLSPRSLCRSAAILVLTCITAQVISPHVSRAEPTSAQAGTTASPSAPGTQQKTPAPAPLSLQQFVQSLQFVSLITEKTDLSGDLPFTIQNTLLNAKVYYRFPGDLSPTQFYPRADYQPGWFDVKKGRNMFLVQFTRCGGTVECTPAKTDSASTPSSTNKDVDFVCPKIEMAIETGSRDEPCVEVIFVRDLIDKNTGQWKPAFVITKSLSVNNDRLAPANHGCGQC